MKKVVCVLLVLLFPFSCLSTALAASYEETRFIETQTEKVKDLESRYGVCITPHDANSTDYLAPSALEEVENYLIIMDAFVRMQRQNEVGVSVFEEEISFSETLEQTSSTVTSWDIDRSNYVDDYVTLADGSRFNVRGNVYYEGYAQKTVTDGKVYLSGYISNCYVEGIYTGTQSFLGGSLNIQGNGTTAASYCPSGTLLFEVSFQAMTVSGRHTFWYPIIDFVTP